MKIVIFLVGLLFFASGYSQNQKVIELHPDVKYSQDYLDSLLVNAAPIRVSQLKKVLESDNSLFGWTSYYKSMANIMGREDKYDSIIYYATKGIAYYNNSKIKRPVDESFLVHTYDLLAYAKGALKDYDGSIRDYQKALDLSKKHPYKWISFTYTGLARAHSQIGNDSLALVYYLKGSKDSLYMNIPRANVVVNTEIGALYEKNKELDLAKSYYLKSIIKTNNSSYKDNISVIHGYLGLLYFSVNNAQDSTHYHIKKAYEANKEYGIGTFRGAQEDHDFFASYIAIFEDRLTEGKTTLLNLIDKISDIKSPNESDKALMLASLKLLDIVYDKQKSHNDYTKMIPKTINFFNRAQEFRIQQNIQNLETRYQTKEKDASISQLEENKAQQEKIIKQQRIIAYSLGGFLLLLSGLGYLFWRQRKFKNQYEKENLEQRLLRSQMNPHFVSNALNTACALVEKKSENTIPYINKLATLFRLTLDNSREEFVSLDEEIAALKSYLELQSNLSKDFDFEIIIDDAIAIEDTILPPMLLQPFVENAIIHGLAREEDRGRIEINISKEPTEKLLRCIISDNGTGYDDENQLELTTRKSVSGDIVRERLSILKKKFKVNARFTIMSTENKGTQVELYVPYLID